MTPLHTADTLVDNPTLSNIGSSLTVVTVGFGGIGEAMCNHLINDDVVAALHVVSSQKIAFDSDKVVSHQADITDESALKQVADNISSDVDVIVCTTGFLHDENTQPEKRLKDIGVEAMQKNYLVNAIIPMLCAKTFLPKVNRRSAAVFAALSARVGSISDNGFGGWYSYRASKAALNMHLKTLSIEMFRTHKQLKILGLHPGTVDTGLSSPFQGNVPEGKLFTPPQSTGYLLNVLANSDQYDSGQVIDWAGMPIPA